MDGYAVCRQLRAASASRSWSSPPGAPRSTGSLGLELGADDYMVKPFGFRELVARIRAVLRGRRVPQPADPRLEQPQVLGALTVDRRARRVLVDGRRWPCRPKEFDLLALLAEDPGAVVSRQTILEEVWDPHWYGPTKTVDVHVASLRRSSATPSGSRPSAGSASASATPPSAVPTRTTDRDDPPPDPVLPGDGPADPGRPRGPARPARRPPRARPDRGPGRTGGDRAGRGGQRQRRASPGAPSSTPPSPATSRRPAGRSPCSVPAGHLLSASSADSAADATQERWSMVDGGPRRAAVGRPDHRRRSPLDLRRRAGRSPVAARPGRSSSVCRPRRRPTTSTISGRPWAASAPACCSHRAGRGAPGPLALPPARPPRVGRPPPRRGRPGRPGPTRRRTPAGPVPGRPVQPDGRPARRTWSTPRAASWPTPRTSCVRRSPPSASGWRTSRPARPTDRPTGCRAAGREVQRLSRIVDGLLTLNAGRPVPGGRPGRRRGGDRRPLRRLVRPGRRAPGRPGPGADRRPGTPGGRLVAGRPRPDPRQPPRQRPRRQPRRRPDPGRADDGEPRRAGRARRRRGARDERRRPRAGLRPVLAGARHSGGHSGLGLAIVRHLALRNDASVELRPAHPTGIDAVVRLPGAGDRRGHRIGAHRPG